MGSADDNSRRHSASGQPDETRDSRAAEGRADSEHATAAAGSSIAGPSGADSATTIHLSGAAAALRGGAVEQPGQMIGRYKLLKEIGEGGFGVVYLAEQQQPVWRQVALKIIKLGMDTRQVIARFEAERQALALMDHPNIARVLDAGATDAGRPYFVMELVRGVPITEYCDRCRMAFRERLALFTRVCSAVQHAHQKGIIHRDLKPSNVLVTQVDDQPTPKVIDFGIAKATQARLTQQTLFTEIGQFIGTPAYMSPEQADPAGEDIDTRSDIYSLGVLLYELLTGATPFDSKSLRRAGLDEIKRIIREEEPPRPSTRLSSLGAELDTVARQRAIEPRSLRTILRGDLDWIIMKALEKDRARRYETANGLALDIERFLAGDAVLAAPPSASYRLRKFVRRNRGAVAAAAAVAAALLIGAAGFAWQARVAVRQRDRAVAAEAQTQQRADELQRVADYQAKILQQVDVTAAGVGLMEDLRRRHAAALEKANVPETDRAPGIESFERELHAVNATDAAVALLDRTVLAPAIRTIETQFADQPLVDATLRTTLGAVYEALGRYEAALPLYERAYNLRAERLGAEHPDTLRSRGGVGGVLGRLQRFPEADSALRAVLAGFQRVLGDDAPETLDATALLASERDYEGRYEESEALTRDLLQRRTRIQGPEHPETLTTMNDLGRYLMLRGKYAEAATVLRAAIEAQRRVADASAVSTLENLGGVLVRQREYAAAEPVLREALERRRRDRGEDHPDTLTAMSALATALQYSGGLSEAESLARELLEKSRRVYGNEHGATLKAMNIMGQVLFRQNKFAETEPYYREALMTGRRVLGDEHPDTIIWVANYGSVLQRLGRAAEAETHYREALDRNRRAMGETHPYTYAISKSLGELLRQQNRPAEAEAHFRTALENARRVEGEDHAETVALVGLLGGVLRDLGKLDEADAYLQLSMEQNRRLNGEEHANTLTAILRVATLRAAQGRHAEVLSLLLPIQDKVKPAFPGMTGVLRHASLQGLLGQARAGLATQPADFAAAEANLLEAHEAFARNRGDRDKETRDWARALADFYAAWDKAAPGAGHDASAAQWKAKPSAASSATQPATSAPASAPSPRKG